MSKKAITISTSTCPPCRVLGEIMKSKYPEGLEGYKKVTINTEGLETADDVAAYTYMKENGIGGVPCTVFFEDGEPIGHMMGGSPFTVKRIEQFLEVEETPLDLG